MNAPEPGEHFCKHCGLQIFFGARLPETVVRKYDKYDTTRKERDDEERWRHLDTGHPACKIKLAEPS